MAWPSHFVFGVETRLENIYVPVQFQGHKAKDKVIAAKKRPRANLSFGHSLIASITNGYSAGKSHSLGTAGKFA